MRLFETTARENKYHPWAKGVLGRVFALFSDEYRITSEVKVVKEGFLSRDDEHEHLVVLRNTDKGFEGEINKNIARRTCGDKPSYDVIRIYHNDFKDPTVAHKFLTHAQAKQIVEKWNAEVVEQREQKAKEWENYYASKEHSRRLRNM